MRSRLLPLPDPFRLVPRFLLRSQSILSLNESRAGFRREGFGEKEDEDEHADVEEGGEVEDREDVVGVEGDEPRSEDGTDALRNEESKRSVEELEGEEKERRLGRTIPSIMRPMKREKMPALDPSGVESEM